ncbi:MAG: hypothetical protein AAGL34_13945 [Bacteroidota bacterium]
MNITKQSLFFKVFVFLVTLIQAQNTKEVGQKGQLLFNLGPELRVTPVYSTDVTILSDEASFTNIDQQNSGLSLNLGLEYFLTKNLSINYTASLRYDLLFFPRTDGTQDLAASDGNQKIFMGHHFNLTYYLNLFKKGQLFVEGGLSLLNRNSDFSIEQRFFDSEGTFIGTGILTSDYKYSTTRFSVGYRRNRSRLSLGIYITGQTPYFTESTSFLIPHIGYRYSLAMLSEKK